MDLVVFENNKPLVIDEFREGRFDYVELASDVAETKFFQFLFSRRGGRQAGRPLPFATRAPSRADVDVPFQPALPAAARHAQLSLAIRGSSARAASIDALGPEVAQREVDPESGNIEIHCAGFNGRNLYPARDPLRSGLPPQAGPRHGAGGVGGVVQPPRGGAVRRVGGLRRGGDLHRRRLVPVRARQPEVRGLGAAVVRRAQPSGEQGAGAADDQAPSATVAAGDAATRRCFCLHCDAAGERFVVAGVRVSAGHRFRSHRVVAAGGHASWQARAGRDEDPGAGPRLHQRPADRPLEARTTASTP